MILSENYNLDTNFKSNSNLLLLGSPGTGKTRMIMSQLCEAEDKSFVILDPKGEICDYTADMMKKKGYKIKVLDFIEPDSGTVRYNPLNYINNYNDILSIANSIVTSNKPVGIRADPFWDRSSIVLCSALLSYLNDFCPDYQKNFKSLAKLIIAAEPNPATGRSKLDAIFEEISSVKPDSYALRQYRVFRAAADRTLHSIIISLGSDLCAYLTPEMERLLSEDTLDIPSLGKTKTVLYVKSSDIDRSKDAIINILFTQIFNVLYREADSRAEHSLKVPLQVILDDIGTNLKLDRLDCILAGCRSRGIGCTVVLQSIGQLKTCYGEGYDAITNSCQAIVYLGGIDYATNNMVSKLVDLPVGTLLEKDYEDCYVFIQGKPPVCDRKFRLEIHENYRMIKDVKPKGEDTREREV